MAKKQNDIDKTLDNIRNKVVVKNIEAERLLEKYK